MTSGSRKANLPLLAKLLRAYLRSRLRGQTRLTFSLANKFKSLQAIPITIAGRSPFYVDLRDGMSHYWLAGSPWAEYPIEPDEHAVVSRFVKKGDVVFDIGANLGVYITHLADLVGSNGMAYAFEPNDQLLPLLRRTVGGIGNTTLLPLGLSEHPGQTTLYVPNDNTMASLADYTASPALDNWREQIGLTTASEVKCELETIDNLVENNVVRRPSFIKCDVEGAELMVFKGGRKTLNSVDAPMILFEALAVCASGFGIPRFAALKFLSSLPLAKYQFLEILDGGSLKRMKNSDASSNILAVPGAKTLEVSELSKQ